MQTINTSIVLFFRIKILLLKPSNNNKIASFFFFANFGFRIIFNYPSITLHSTDYPTNRIYLLVLSIQTSYTSYNSSFWRSNLPSNYNPQNPSFFAPTRWCFYFPLHLHFLTFMITIHDIKYYPYLSYEPLYWAN